MWEPTGTRQGFELVDVVSGEVWLTKDWTVQDFEKFDLPISQALWLKNDPRTGAAQSGKFLRSPGCEPGQFTYMQAHGREFLHVVDLDGLPRELDDKGLIRAVQLNKHHSLNFDEGAQIEVLSDPSGQRFVLIARTLLEVEDDPSLPEGWSLESFVLAAPFKVQLDGKVSVLRMDNEDSFQGPLPADAIFPKAP
ncbi:MAG: hypothetical protein AAFR64_05070 [Pseudomonadota bacterium]